MRVVYFVGTLFLILYALSMMLLVLFNRPWWRVRWVRRAAVCLPVAVAAGGLIWGLGLGLHVNWLSRAGSGLIALVFVYLLSLLVALTVTGSIRLLVGAVDLLGGRSSPNDELPSSHDRRRFLHASLAAIPLAAAATATRGMISSAAPAHIPHIPMAFASLPQELEGLRILHLSDTHTGLYVSLDDLQELVERAARQHPDIVLVTGDICDHMPSYAGSLKIIESLKPTFGTFASLGNHEYIRGIGAVRDSFERSAIPLLVGAGLSVDVGSARLYVSGADDPRGMSGVDAAAGLRRSVEHSQRNAPSDAFRILMSHRSAALDFAAPLGVDLVLAGHTHGFQIGIGGRSLFETLYPESYIWGHYRKGNTQLQTSAGVGHWFPFRLGCPPEAPLYILQSA